MTALLEVGRIVNRHGVRGELRVRLHNPDSDLFSSIERVALVDADGGVDWRDVDTARPHKGCMLVRLTAVESANDAEALIGRAIAVERAQLPAPGDGEVYQQDLLGCPVRTDGGEELGVVAGFIATGSNDVCIVRGRGREYLIPLIDDVIVDFRPGEPIVVRPLPGLLDP
jgi:16S rRNA processing protein RimM